VLADIESQIMPIIANHRACSTMRKFGPRFMVQPPPLPREPLRLDRTDDTYSPVKTAIRKALPTS
jgi:hypothetical protein